MTRHAVVAAVTVALAVGLAQALGTASVSDLTITKTDFLPTYTAGDPVTYTIVVGNAGPDAAVDAIVSDPATSASQVLSAVWTCVAAGGATCNAGPVTGAISDTVDLPVGGTLTYTLVWQISAAATDDLVNTATVTPAVGTTDPAPASNSATDTDTAADIFEVATTGTDSLTCGNSGVACKTIQAAINNAAPGDTILVNNGTYNECPVLDAGIPLRVESGEFRSAGTNAATILDGLDVCDSASDAPGPVVSLSDGSTLRGFTIKDGGRSGVAGTGAVWITGNVISANSSTGDGGGLRVTTGSIANDPAAKTVIRGNTIKDNTCAGSGAGIFVSTLDSADPSDLEIVGNVITGNIAGDGAAGALGAGLAVLSDTQGPADRSQVTIASNTIDGNVAKNAVGDATLAFGGGIFVATGAPGGFGTETVAIGGTGLANIVRNNVSEGLGGGMSINVRPAPTGKHTVNVDSNAVTANSGNFGGGGLHLLLRAVDRAAGAAPDVVFSASGNSIIGNHAQPDPSDPEAVPDPVTSGGGMNVEFQSDRSPAASVLFEISGNTIERNDRATHGGGVALLASADDDPDNDGATQPSDAVISFHHNVVAGNAARDSSSGGASGGGIHAVAVARGGSALARIVQDFLTVAENQTELGAGGIEWEESHPANSVGSSGHTELVLSNSIVTANDGIGVGGTVLPGPSAAATVTYTDSFGNPSGNFEAQLGVVPGTNGVVSIDPALDAFFLPRLCGATIDLGDPAIPATLEPLPNGGRVNLGHLGNTASATRTFPDVNLDGAIDGMDILGIAVSFSAVSPDPRYFTAADRDLNGAVDGDDLAFVSAFYGQSCP